MTNCHWQHFSINHKIVYLKKKNHSFHAEKWEKRNPNVFNAIHSNIFNEHAIWLRHASSLNVYLYICQVSFCSRVRSYSCARSLSQRESLAAVAAVSASPFLSFSSVFVFKPNSIACLLTLWTFHSFSSMIKFHSQWSVFCRRIFSTKIKYYQMLFDSMFIYFYFIMNWCIDICLCHLAFCFMLLVYLQFYNIDDFNGFQLYCLFISMKIYEYWVLYVDWVAK